MTLTLVAAALMLPILWAIAIATKPLDQVYAAPDQLFSGSVRWSNFSDAMTRLPFARFMLNSFLIAIPSVIGAVLTSAMAAYALARLRWRGRTLCLGTVLFALVVPAQVLLIPHFLMYSGLGWVNTYKPLIVPAWLGGGAFNILLFRQFFRTIPRDFQDAALVDGASHWCVFIRIMLPMSKPVLAVAALLSFVWHWHDFLRPLIYLSDFRNYPVSLGLRMYQTTNGSWINLVVAASLVSLLPIAAVFALLQRYLNRGIRLGP